MLDLARESSLTLHSPTAFGSNVQHRRINTETLQTCICSSRHSDCLRYLTGVAPMDAIHASQVRSDEGNTFYIGIADSIAGPAPNCLLPFSLINYTMHHSQRSVPRRPLFICFIDQHLEVFEIQEATGEFGVYGFSPREAPYVTGRMVESAVNNSVDKIRKFGVYGYSSSEAPYVTGRYEAAVNISQFMSNSKSNSKENLNRLARRSLSSGSIVSDKFSSPKS